MADAFERSDPDTATGLVNDYLRGRNLEQLGRVDDAIPLYEGAVHNAFDSTGPYDRLIHIYASTAQHSEVIRVCDAALRSVHTYEDKRTWYARVRADAEQATQALPRAAPRRRE